MMQFDHIAVAAATLAEAIEHVESALGVKMQPGGEHAVFHTHNTLLGLEEGLYLEAIAINPAAPRPDRPRWFDLDRFEGPARLTNWICRCDDMDAVLKQMPNLPPDGAGQPVDLQRGDLRWRMAVPASGVLPYDNCWPALIQWQTTQHPADRLATSGVRLKRLIVSHPQADDLRAALAPILHDDRVVFDTGPAALRAEFDTPHGPRAL
ncbi:VOC family protein [Pseudosulfitobacter pseudonitzschiae]|uniref:VOC family protein n=1 Tax=Pseudosulfitobacter pseudonitzschiae TaxID=1402135 RepID=UPI001AFC1F7B|nr:VOC family protein [Pseudosulfitobacter pseudonitzschiae]MBM1815269.1 VOC family protein [Pseudosulfitobacter pseudonitzschiae]MBM1832260.1 VOC family protein [Pseudosulfitobacter pseudonitzschiae]MBM1837128.1 VOC family protein [Pseudosulfitobacter pseudonitzschiae]MBM1841974.1 VOC family protein [Pseudosulfitobacter pseudonitzschiae]MBM1846842.1 VOC family protein [Pseudosulfitobacter pseudonitzschiae]